MNHIRSQDASWIFRFVLVCLGNPVLFFLFLSLRQFGDSWFTISRVGFNVDWINPLTYTLVTLPLYSLWISINIIGCRVNLETFLEHYVAIVAIVVSMPGLMNLCVWCTSGMEGNIFGLIFFLPMLIATTINFFLWIRALMNSFG